MIVSIYRMTTHSEEMAQATTCQAAPRAHFYFCSENLFLDFSRSLLHAFTIRQPKALRARAEANELAAMLRPDQSPSGNLCPTQQIKLFAEPLLALWRDSFFAFPGNRAMSHDPTASAREAPCHFKDGNCAMAIRSPCESQPHTTHQTSPRTPPGSSQRHLFKLCRKSRHDSRLTTPQPQPDRRRVIAKTATSSGQPVHCASFSIDILNYKHVRGCGLPQPLRNVGFPTHATASTLDNAHSPLRREVEETCGPGLGQK
jgi:hypothetical protein